MARKELNIVSKRLRASLHDVPVAVVAIAIVVAKTDDDRQRIRETPVVVTLKLVAAQAVEQSYMGEGVWILNSIAILRGCSNTSPPVKGADCSRSYL